MNLSKSQMTTCTHCCKMLILKSKQTAMIKKIVG